MTHSLDELVARLRAVESSTDGLSDSVTTCWYRNPNGPEAADTIEQQEAEIKRLRETLVKIAEYPACLTPVLIAMVALDELGVPHRAPPPIPNPKVRPGAKRADRGRNDRAHQSASERIAQPPSQE